MPWKKRIFIALIICFGFHITYGQQFEMIWDGITRTYVVYEPNNLDPNSSEGYPLVVGLHGASSDGYTFIGTAFLIPKAIKEKFIVACPDSLHYPTAWWNAGDGYEEITDGTDDLGFISALIDKLVVDYNIDTTRIYVMAHSNGSMMAYRVAAELSNKIAAIGVNSGQMAYEFEKCNPEFPVPIMHFHGLDDPICPYEGGANEQVVLPPTEEVLNFWGGINNCYSIPYTILDENGFFGRKWTCFDGNKDIILYTIEGWGHHWPRKSEPGLNATDLIWDFLIQHQRITETDSNEWFVTTDGTNLGNGTAEHPWNLETALSRLTIKPGDIVWIAGGTYTGPFVKNLKPDGTKYKPIKYRAIPGEHVTLICDDPNEPALTNKADNVWFWGMEVTGENIQETPETPVSAIEQDSVDGAKYINMVVHDWPNGSGFDVGHGGTELTGCISYNNGKSGYTGLNGPNDVNDSVADLPWLRYYDCIAFNNSEGGFTHDSNSQQIANILHRGCAAYDNGHTSGWTGTIHNFYFCGSQFDDNFVMQNCFTYSLLEPFTGSTVLLGSAILPMDGYITVENNIFAGGGEGAAINGWDAVIFQGNICYTAPGALLHIGAIGDANNYMINYNTYYQGSDKFLYKERTHYETLEAWQAATGWDANSIQISGQPQKPWIYLRENKYEPDLANLIIYNWSDANTVTVDMNDLWPEDANKYVYRVINVEDIRGEPVVEGTLTDGIIEVPMQGEFACYIVKRKVD